MLTRYDKFLLYFLILLALFSFIVIVLQGDSLSESDREVIIVAKGEEVIRCNLNVDRLIEIEGSCGTSVVELSKGKVRMVSSACPNKACVKQGWIRKSNQVIVCAPNKVLIRIAGSQKEDFLDAVSR